MTAPGSDPSTYQAVVDEIQDQIASFSSSISSLVSSAGDLIASPLLQLLPVVQDAISWLVDQIVDLAESIWSWIVQAARGIAAPLVFLQLGNQWQDHVQGPASGVAADVAITSLLAPRDWKGDASDAYTGAVAGQSLAAKGVQDMAGSVGLHLQIVGVAGVVFYAALAAAAAKAVLQLVLAELAIDSGVGAPLGLGGALATMVGDGGVILLMITAMLAFVTAQATGVGNIGLAANNRQAFPNGAWPVGTA